MYSGSAGAGDFPLSDGVRGLTGIETNSGRFCDHNRFRGNRCHIKL
ncbi:MAG: hypothetical protein ACLTDF_08600 [Coprococcus sp.]